MSPHWRYLESWPSVFAGTVETLLAWDSGNCTHARGCVFAGPIITRQPATCLAHTFLRAKRFPREGRSVAGDTRLTAASSHTGCVLISVAWVLSVRDILGKLPVRCNGRQINFLRHIMVCFSTGDT
jgi:hypothetical protein